MNIKRKDGQLCYRKLRTSYSAYGENKKYSARATITIHSGDHTTEILLELDHDMETLEEAENEIIKRAKKRIDCVK